MRPLPSEVVAGVRRILADSIEPELTSGHARSKLRELRAVLAQVDWDDAGFVLASRNRALSGVLRRIEAWRVADSARRAAIAKVVTAEPECDSMAAHQSCYETLAASAVALVEPLRDWMAAHPDDDAAALLMTELLETL